MQVTGPKDLTCRQRPVKAGEHSRVSGPKGINNKMKYACFTRKEVLWFLCASIHVFICLFVVIFIWSSLFPENTEKKVLGEKKKKKEPPTLEAKDKDQEKTGDRLAPVPCVALRLARQEGFSRDGPFSTRGIFVEWLHLRMFAPASQVPIGAAALQDNPLLIDVITCQNAGSLPVPSSTALWQETA